MSGNTRPPVQALSAKQEHKLMAFLDDRFLEITRAYKMRSQPTTNLPTLSSYLNATRDLLSLILQVPPVDPSTSLRTALLLRFTGDTLNSIPGYPPVPDVLPEVIDWLDDLDQAWLSVLQSQSWDPVSRNGVDLVVEASAPLRSSPLSQTERTRLHSLLVGGEASLEEWLSGMDTSGDEDLQAVLQRVGVQEGFDDLFSRTLDELGALGIVVGDPVGMIGTC